MSKTTEDFKEILLRFVSSELTSHASGIIGFSIILFAYLNVISQFYPDRIPFTPCFYHPASTRTLFVFLILWAINTLIIYTLLRVAYYGKIASELIQYDKPTNSSKELWDKVTNEIRKETFFTVPFEWFRKGISSLSIGFWLSLFVSFVVSSILIWTFLFY